MPISRKAIDAETVRRELSYCPETGVFVRLTGRYAGQVAGTFCPPGYRRIMIGGCIFYAHRLAWLYVYGEWPDEIDHINCVKSDNRICNLRVASRSQNMANVELRTVFGRKGVSRSRRKNRPDGWAAYIRIDGKSVRLGTFDRIEDAAAAYQSAAADIHGDFARF